MYQAAQYSIKRRQLTDELCGVVSDYPDPDPLANSNAMEFYGQRSVFNLVSGPYMEYYLGTFVLLVAAICQPQPTHLPLLLCAVMLESSCMGPHLIFNSLCLDCNIKLSMFSLKSCNEEWNSVQTHTKHCLRLAQRVWQTYVLEFH